MSYDSNNIFAKMLRGEIPAHKVYEDEDVIAVLDIMPQAKGHTLVIPRAPSRNLLDAAPETLARLLPAVRRLAEAIKSALAADGITIKQYNEAAGGQTVFHLHVHIIPRFDGVPLKSHSGEKERPEVLAEHAEKIKAKLARNA